MKSQPPEFGARKTPKQQRAKEKVERILDTATALVISEGSDALTTNKIAAKANINIASLYQYFPNKEAIIAALFYRIEEQVSKVIISYGTQVMSQPVDKAVRQMLQFSVMLYRQSENLYSELTKGYHSILAVPGSEILEKAINNGLRRYLNHNRDSIKIDNMESTIFVLMNSAFFVVFRHLSQPTGYLRDEEVIDEVVKMVSKYLE